MDVEKLTEENEKLKSCLKELIAWFQPIYGPSWATDEVKQKNYDGANKAFMRALECFREKDRPFKYNS